ncbi:putative fatty-acid--CoA ligase [Caenibius tardaugens NBRC 16725]|uniref:Putative fatty-acid--CoA ligase n=1 Tax=Caenibius tardaugens NBRC 16725 TaxID=1219035 RepID=U2YNU1_9SPHN|nr:long-chain-acyl-CoA synthetase [Caenibius tardaugens]AZI35072.1 long-chain-acyl-CoA synthetase [Caenibius tardaugens NBRC 16725]GAD50257.1 putative fatty-acid--CoA ligase [Caenibius tardaugens NBRC 16725]
MSQVEIRPSREESMARYMKGASRVMGFTRDMPYLVPDRLEERAADSGDVPFILFEEQRITFADANRRANQIANAAMAQGLKRGDVVALMMYNRPEFVLYWLGLSKAGIVTALINTSATGAVLRHALTQVNSRALIIDRELIDALDTLDGPAGLPVLIDAEPGREIAPKDGQIDFAQAVAQASEETPSADLRKGLVAADPLYLIFTSGTTGMPKGAKMSHLRFLNSGEMMGGLMEFNKDSVFYCVLPLYHGAGGMVVPSASLAFGVPFLLRRKFSRSGFWPDVRRHKVTAAYYIGEIVRYLMASPPQPDDRDHTLRKLAGAGLKPDVWRAFVDRFGIEGIYEGLGSTEANYGITNVDNIVGSVGRIPYPEYTNIRVLRWDVETDGYMLDENGKPILAGPDEVGELVAEVLYGNDPGGFFEGYTSEEATEAKLLRGLFRPDDAWVKSGDLIRMDADGYVYFVDRVGDTFRWKSENVSTQEVETVLAGLPGLDMVNVYGVRIPHTEGRAGMAALTFQSGHAFDPEAFYAFASERLASYAVPLFVRLSGAADMTTTFKLRKGAVQREGYDPALTGEPVFVVDPAAQTYVPVTPDALERLGIAPFQQEGN